MLHYGNMLVLSRPSPKPIVSPRQPSPPPATQPPDQPPVESDSISLRPLGRTGLAPSLSHLTFPLIQSKDSSVLPKTNRFVPPHLRPGFHGREAKPICPCDECGSERAALSSVGLMKKIVGRLDEEEEATIRKEG
ncbi:hypothetical protein Ccrd_001352 [Cynara cardunculus var. scolymus]|uniref:Uncharacterized protein n=1 Tax=Cynara cardunculus var. scolymus TaxID=59895 RepID=A0A103XTH8_CYNCS|nr:hypothetical protein Ccrd_001352 [Cynara cardunculus var. scolymus]